MSKWDSSDSEGESDQESENNELLDKLKQQYTDITSPIAFADVATIY